MSTMSVFGTILEKLGLHKHSDGGRATTAPGTTASRSSTTASPSASPGTHPQQQQTGTSGTAASAQRQSGPATATTTTAAPPPSAVSEVDVTAKLEQLAAQNPQTLNWRTSIVDLMKLLGMESSLAERKELATELGYPSDQMSDTARMNMWLHKQVLNRIAQNGGKVPKELLN
jgi:hypothetical protein